MERPSTCIIKYITHVTVIVACFSTLKRGKNAYLSFLLGKKLQTVKENAEIFIKASKDIGLEHGSSTRGPRATCGPRASVVRPGKGISQNTMSYEY